MAQGDKTASSAEMTLYYYYYYYLATLTLSGTREKRSNINQIIQRSSLFLIDTIREVLMELYVYD